MDTDSAYLYDFDTRGIEPVWVLDQLTTISVEYIDFIGRFRSGNIVCNTGIAKDLSNIFIELYRTHFLIECIYPISKYDWNDEKSALANNTSCFNYRHIEGTSTLSVHSIGMAIDINPFQNPWIHPELGNLPPDSAYDINATGVITTDVVQLFKSYGFKWGGDWKNPDYMHFYKELV